VEKNGKPYNTNIVIDVVLFAITFNANNATGGTPPAQIYSASNISIPGQGTMTRTGHTFGGWNTNSSGTGTNYNAGSSYTPTGNITLYARWISTTRTIRVDMYDSYGDGWDGSGALRIIVNGIQIATNVKVQNTAANNTPSGQRSTNTYSFNATIGDVVQFYWVAGSAQGENSFIVYYTNTPPSPVFTTSNQGPTSWSGSNALLFRVRNTMNSVINGTLLGSFTVQ